MGAKKEHIEIADRLIEYLNECAQKNYRLIDSNRRNIINRLKDGYTEQECEYVIRNQSALWKGTEMELYLRCETLFRPSKFEGYLNAPPFKIYKELNKSTSEISHSDSINDRSWAE